MLALTQGRTGLARPFVALAVLLLTASVAGCGASGPTRPRATDGAAATQSRTATTSSRAGASQRGPTEDYDHDNDGGDDDVNWGRAASAAEFRAVRGVVEAYYAAGAAGEGARGCSLIYSLFAEEIPEEYGEGSGPPGLRGKTCAVVLSKLFRRRREQFRSDGATLRVFRVRVRGLRGLAFLRLAHSPIHDIPVHREHAAWRIEALLDGPLG